MFIFITQTLNATDAERLPTTTIQGHPNDAPRVSATKMVIIGCFGIGIAVTAYNLFFNNIEVVDQSSNCGFPSYEQFIESKVLTFMCDLQRGQNFADLYSCYSPLRCELSLLANSCDHFRRIIDLNSKYNLGELYDQTVCPVQLKEFFNHPLPKKYVEWVYFYGATFIEAFLSLKFPKNGSFSCA